MFERLQIIIRETNVPMTINSPYFHVIIAIRVFLHNFKFYVKCNLH